MNTLTGTHKTIILLAVIICVVALEAYALSLGHNGIILTAVVAGLFSVASFLFGRKPPDVSGAIALVTGKKNPSDG